MNRNKKIRFWNGIRFKMTTGLLILLIFSGFLLYFLVMTMMSRNMESQVTADLQNLQGNTEVYVRQFLMLNERNNDEDSFRESAADIAEELYNTSKNKLLLFTNDGKPLLDYGFGNTKDMNILYEDVKAGGAFSSALKGESAYQLNAGSAGEYDVWFSMPLNIAGKNMGIVSYYLDYSAQYQQFNDIARTVLEITIIILLMISALILLFLSNIIRPIQRLSKISSRVTDEIKNDKISTGNLIKKSLTRRKDELGQLSRNYSLMLKTAESQFAKIQEDRNNILQLLNSKQEFYNNVTHELKTPLTTIKGYAQLMEDDGLEDEELFHTGLNHIQHESSRLHQMVIQLLEMSDKELHTQLVPLDIAATLNSVTASMSLKAKRYNNKIITKGLSSLMILGHEERIRQLFINLIDNAIKYGQPKEVILATSELQDEKAVIQITNKGEGILPEEVDHIFDPFYRVDKEHSREIGSAGLGLSICKKIVDEHQGEITVDSKPGDCTTFTVRFTAYKEDTEYENDF